MSASVAAEAPTATSPTVISAAASGISEGRLVVLKVTVEVSADKSDVILVREGDCPRSLAADFCQKHRLQPSLVAPLANHIRNNLIQEEHDGNSMLQGCAGESLAAAAAAATAVAATAGCTDDVAAAAAGDKARYDSQAWAEALGPLISTAASSSDAATVIAPRTPVSTARSYEAWQLRPGDSPGRRDCSTGRRHLTPPQAQSVPRARPAAALSTATAPRTPKRGAATPRRSTTPCSEGGASSRTSALLRQAARSGSGDSGAGSARRFESLHQDAQQRRCRLQRLQHQVQRELEEQEQHRRTQAAVSSSAPAARGQRCPEEPSGRAAGDRLYRDAAKRKVRMEQLQQQRQAEQELVEQQEATFRPVISRSQRSCQGIGRSMRDPEGRSRRSKLEQLREVRDDAELEGCTFHPQIDWRSEEIMTQRLARMQVQGNLYDALYEDAMRRRERQLDWETSLPAGATFRPDLCESRVRGDEANTSVSSLNRLAYSKCQAERWLALRRQLMENRDVRQAAMQESRSQPDFHPQVGRGPFVERNRDGLPIGEFLYEAGRERALQHRAQAEAEEGRSRSQPSTPRVGETSRVLLEETKQRKYRDLFDTLVRRDPELKLRSATWWADGLDEELLELLRPLFAVLREHGDVLDFDAFCAALDFHRRQSAAPTSHLFVQKGSARTSDSYRQQCDDERFEPRTNPRSDRLAARRRPQSAPLHERLHRERGAREQRLQEQRQLREERELQECTFQPNARPGSAGSTRQPTAGGAVRSDSGSPPRAAGEGITRPLAQEGRSSAPRRRSSGSLAAAALRPGSPADGQLTESYVGDPPAVLLGHLSLCSGSQSGSGSGGSPTGYFEEAESSLGHFCQEQLDQVEKAVAHCKSVAAMAKQTVAAVDAL